MSFPSSPSNDQIYTRFNRKYRYSSSNKQWIVVKNEVETISSVSLGQLADVDTTNVTDGQALVWDSASSSFVASTVSGGGSGTTNYNDLTNKPTIPADVSDLTDTTSLLFDGNYNSLTNTPTIPADISDLTDTTSLLSTSYEIIGTKSGATGTVEHDTTSINTFYHTSISANFTANFTNVSTTDDKVIVLVLVLDQGATAYLPTVIQIDGSTVTPKWIDNITPAGTANAIDVISYSLLRSSSTWTIMASLSTFE